MLAKKVVNRNDLSFFIWYESAPNNKREIDPNINGRNLAMFGSYLVKYKNFLSNKLNKIGL